MAAAKGLALVAGVDWQFMLVIGLFIGAFFASRLSGSFRVSLVPDLFAARFGPGAARRWGIGMLGGVLLGFGARLADGCTSGHTISGAAQLALSGWVATLGFFGGGIALALLLYGRRSY